MRYYIDFEFDDVTLRPISLGMVSQTGETLYLVNVNWRVDPASDWVKQNVHPHLYTRQAKSYHTDHWAGEIVGFLGDDREPQFWGFFADYDWVIFCKLFGTMLQLPEHFPKHCLDLKQLALSVGIEGSLKKMVPQKDEHNALADAEWNKQVHEQIIFQHGRVI